MQTEPLVIEHTFNAPADRVWKALTDKNEMKQWYFDIKKFKLEVGFSFEFYAGSEEKQYLHLCKIMEIIPGKKLSYTWRYENEPGNTLVTFELFPEGGKTRLRLTHEGLETFPLDKPDFAKENFMTGWAEIIGTNLKKFVESQALA